jgi:hypothetical protein
VQVQLAVLEQNVIATSLDSAVVCGGQEEMVPDVDRIDSYSDAGFQNSEEEQELAEYFKEIEEENKVEERLSLDGASNGAALAAIPVALA